MIFTRDGTSFAYAQAGKAGQSSSIQELATITQTTIDLSVAPFEFGGVDRSRKADQDNQRSCSRTTAAPHGADLTANGQQPTANRINMNLSDGDLHPCGTTPSLSSQTAKLSSGSTQATISRSKDQSRLQSPTSTSTPRKINHINATRRKVSLLNTYDHTESIGSAKIEIENESTSTV